MDVISLVPSPGPWKAKEVPNCSLSLLKRASYAAAPLQRLGFFAHFGSLHCHGEHDHHNYAEVSLSGGADTSKYWNCVLGQRWAPKTAKGWDLTSTTLAICGS